jgi:hypothetical protein
LWQIATIPLANLFEFVPLRKTPSDVDPPVETPQRWGQFTRLITLQSSVETVAFAISAWGEWTGQEQGWNMFTPGFPPQTVLPAVELQLGDGRVVRAYSRFEARRPARWPLIHDREFNYEANLFMIAWHATPQELHARPETWRQLPEKVRENHSLILAWLNWRVRSFLAEYPGERVQDATLLLRCFPTPSPENPAAQREPAYELPFARLILQRPPEPGELPLQGYDPIAKEWVRLRVWDGP